MKTKENILSLVPTQGITPIEIFNRAHVRSMAFISGGVGNKGRRDADDLRAAVVFAVASIDTFFRAKIVHILLTERSSMSNFSLSDSTRKIIQKTIAKKIFSGREYNQLNLEEKNAVDAMCESKKPYLIRYLQVALTEMSFQGVSQLDEGIKMMGKKPQEIWQKVISYEDNNSSSQKSVGRPKKKRRGKKTDIKVQLKNLFSRRHKIVHEADLNLQSRKHRGQERKISYDTVKNWIDSTEKIIKKLDSVISET